MYERTVVVAAFSVEGAGAAGVVSGLRATGNVVRGCDVGDATATAGFGVAVGFLLGAVAGVIVGATVGAIVAAGSGRAVADAVATATAVVVVGRGSGEGVTGSALIVGDGTGVITGVGVGSWATC